MIYMCMFRGIPIFLYPQRYPHFFVPTGLPGQPDADQVLRHCARLIANGVGIPNVGKGEKVQNNLCACMDGWYTRHALYCSQFSFNGHLQVWSWEKNMVHIAQIKASNVGRVNNINKHHGKHDAIMMQTWCKHVAMVLPKPSTTIATTTTAMITTPGYFSCISNSIIIHHGRWSGWWWRYPMGTSHLQMSHFGGQTHCWGYTHWCLQCEVFWLHSEWWLKHAAWVCFCDKSFLFVFPSFLSCT